MSDPSGSYGGWKVGAIDANNQAAQSILKQDYKDDITKEEAVQLALTEWPEGPLEEIVQNGIKSWEMELSHKIRLQDFKTIVPKKLKLFFNGSLCYFGHLAPIAGCIYLIMNLNMLYSFLTLFELMCFILKCYGK